MLAAYRELLATIEEYNQVKELSVIKYKETLVFEEVSEILAELSAWPGMAIEPQ